MLKLEHVKKTFNKGSANEVILYRDLNVEIHDGEFVTIIGSNGSGKSTFFNVISGNIRQDAGSVSFNGKDVSRLPEHKRSQFIGRVFQDPQKGTSPSLTILQNMAMAYHKGKSFGLTKGVDKALIPLFERELADMQLGLESKLHVSVGSLSGGQRQASENKRSDYPTDQENCGRKENDYHHDHPQPEACHHLRGSSADVSQGGNYYGYTKRGKETADSGKAD